MNIPSNSPTAFSERRRKMMGPFVMMLETTRMESTTMKTEQKERQN